jgi:hypothetical protein
MLGNKLEGLSSKMFEPIAGNKLQSVDFCYNKKINAIYQPGIERSVALLEELMDIIDKNCDLPFDEEEREEFDQYFTATLENLWTSGLDHHRR